MSGLPFESDRADEYFGYLRTRNGATLQFWTASSEEEFIEAVDAALANVVAQLESGGKLLRSAEERLLSWTLATYLHAAGINATPEAYHNGHVDITIAHPLIDWLRMLGETKIYRGYSRHIRGCEQLLGYSSGRQRRAFCLEFFQRPGMYLLLEKLQARIDIEKPLQLVGSWDSGSIQGAFVTRHRHSGSGALVEILHLGCNVAYDKKEGAALAEAQPS